MIGTNKIAFIYVLLVLLTNTYAHAQSLMQNSRSYTHLSYSIDDEILITSQITEELNSMLRFVEDNEADSSKTKRYLKTILTKAESSNDSLLTILASIKLGQIHFKYRDFKNAYDYYFKSYPFVLGLTHQDKLKGFFLLDVIKHMAYSEMKSSRGELFPELITQLKGFFLSRQSVELESQFLLFQVQWHYVFKSDIAQIYAAYFELEDYSKKYQLKESIIRDLSILNSQIKAQNFATIAFSLVFIFFAYGLIAYLVSRKNDYLSYTVFLLFLIIYGSLEFNFYRYSIVLNTTVGSKLAFVIRDILGFLSLTFYNFFVVHYLRIKKASHGKAFTYNRYLTYLYLTSLTVFELGYYLIDFNEFLYRVGLLVIILIAVVQNVFFTAKVWHRNQVSVQFIAAGTSFLFIGILGYMMFILFDLLQYVHISYYILFGGLIAQIVTFNAGLSYDAYYAEKERFTVQEKLVSELKRNQDLIENQNKVLEFEVHKRTQELVEKNTTLESANEEIQRQRDDVIHARDRLEKALTDLKSAQEQIVQQEKLASLGQLTAGIAHEIKNPLNFVTNFSVISQEMIAELSDEIQKIEQNLVEEFDIDLTKELIDDIKSNLHKIHEHGTRADRIIKSMLEHSRGVSGEKRTTSINEIIQEFCNLTYHGMRASSKPIQVEMHYELEEELPNVELNKQDFSRVIINIVSNAFDAMWEKMQHVEGYKPKLDIVTQIVNNHIEFSLTDNGIGMSTELQKSILQPFFTTKKGTDGTGLGLSITNDILTAHGFHLNIESVPNEYSRFIISIPIKSIEPV